MVNETKFEFLNYGNKLSKCICIGPIRRQIEDWNMSREKQCIKTVLMNIVYKPVPLASSVKRKL